jgi:transcriptional regulator with XRE-family HTH domain
MRLRVAELREAAGLTQRDLAFKAGVDKATVVRLEQREAVMPAPWILRKIARALSVSVEELEATTAEVGPR